jgi:hypothetical protein
MRSVALVAVAGCLAAVSAGCAVADRGAGAPLVSYQGYGGTAIVSADGRTVTVVITWQENGLTDYITIGTQDARSSPQMLTTRQLITIADSAPHQGPQS